MQSVLKSAAEMTRPVLQAGIKFAGGPGSPLAAQDAPWEDTDTIEELEELTSQKAPGMALEASETAWGRFIRDNYVVTGALQGWSRCAGRQCTAHV